MSKKQDKIRLDVLLVQNGLTKSRERAQALIMAGKVFLGERMLDKPGIDVDKDAQITVKEDLPYVGRGGVKLEGALDSFGVDVTGLLAIDVGSSTGGFTDCLLQRGAAKVVAIDVGKGLLDIGLRNDARVRVLEEKNIRYLKADEIGEAADMAVIDVSFISLKLVLPSVRGLIKDKARVLALVKPQFEVGKGEVGKGGIVRDPAKHKASVDGVRSFAEENGFKALNTCESPIKGGKGNTEFWLYLEKA